MRSHWSYMACHHGVCSGLKWSLGLSCASVPCPVTNFQLPKKTIRSSTLWTQKYKLLLAYIRPFGRNTAIEPLDCGNLNAHNPFFGSMGDYA